MNKIEKLIKELKKEILGEELSLIQLDNLIKKILNTKQSIFDYDLERDIFNGINGSMSYFIAENQYINIEFTLIKKEKEIIKITKIEEI